MQSCSSLDWTSPPCWRRKRRKSSSSNSLLQTPSPGAGLCRRTLCSHRLPLCTRSKMETSYQYVSQFSVCLSYTQTTGYRTSTTSLWELRSLVTFIIQSYHCKCKHILYTVSICVCLCVKLYAVINMYIRQVKTKTSTMQIMISVALIACFYCCQVAKRSVAG